MAASSQINIKDSPKDLLKLKSHQRALISTVPDMSKSEVLTYNGISTVIAPLNIEDTEVMARCGAEVIIVGKTDSGQKVVLFVKNPKSPKFLELPGGGLYHKSDTYDGIVKQRIKFKTGLDLSDISNISDTGKGIILNEEKTAKDKNLKSICSYSYYRLFTAEYVNEIPDADVAGYSYDNRQMAADMKIAGESGYTAYLT